ncbi:peptide chain release factor N(5)-glutamine methyltransferase [Limosilactobacillus caecicola]|uniref:peptide chain release factor N(5)-glutamine methyltransferase n=1 Tax=Limosilactobacillus caecicola TaxID=2941332 RepID=UPI0020414BEE|nr:peptide chain release factor N(5)-glutamine methyltransferase [Limosilactobacillus caecicola]
MSNWTYFQAQRWASSFLKKLNRDPNAPRFVLMMIHGWSDADLLMHNREIMSDDEKQRYQAAILRIAKDEPTQYVVGKAPFFGRTFVVNSDVLIPEVETEDLIEWVLAEMPEKKPLKVLDLGTGSGVIGITLALERPRWQVTLSDISASALRVATANQRLHGTNLRQVTSDLFAELTGERFDLIVTNPPYVSPNALDVIDPAVVKYEPPLALFASENGLGFYHRLFHEIDAHLNPDGVLFGETGYDQEESIQRLFYRLQPTATIQTKHDLADRMRMIKAWNFDK